VTDPIGPGAFVALVGASGVGKDALPEPARSGCTPAAVNQKPASGSVWPALTRPPATASTR
jgi:ribose 1,5-bisphosphokinase PhnN